MTLPIAERILFIVDGDKRAEVGVRLFAPRQSGPNEWQCDLEIDWPDGVLRRYAAGHDSVQALELAMKMIGINLYTSDAHENGRLMWERPGGGYGFPVTNNIRDLLIGDDKQYRSPHERSDMRD